MLAANGWQHTRAFVRGAAIGSLVLTYFGAFWAFASLVNRPGVQIWVFGLFSIPVVGLTLLAVLRLAGSGRLPPADGLSASQGRRAGRLFAIVVAVEVALILLAVQILGHVNRPMLIPVAIAFVVGLHFLPLATVFHMPIYSATGTAIIGAALASLLIGNERTRLFALGIGLAAILWASAARVLMTYGVASRPRVDAV